MKTLFTHGKDLNGRRFTIAARYDFEKILIDYAICGKKDQFEKKIGRYISEGRCLKNPRIIKTISWFPKIVETSDLFEDAKKEMFKLKKSMEENGVEQFCTKHIMVFNLLH
jgi:hypothetical protein